MSDRLVEEALKYFAGEPVLRKLLQAVLEKYKSLGRVGGSVFLKGLNQEECEVLSQFFRRSFYPGEDVRIKTEEISRALEKTRFSQVDFPDLLKAYAGGEILTREEIREQNRHEMQATIARLKEKCRTFMSRDWVKSLERRDAGSQVFYHNWKKNPKGTENEAGQVIKALEFLPENNGKGYIRLPLLAAEVTGDPHGLDPNHFRGRLFLTALNYTYHCREGLYEYTPPAGSENLHALWEYFGLIKDDLNSFVICTGFRGEGEGEEVLQAAFSRGRVLNLPLREVISLQKIFPGPGERIYIIENPAVFSELVDCFAPHQPPMICANGQLRLAARAFLDMLPEKGCYLYYAGDFDPEGLVMAQNFLKRWPKNSHLWLYGSNQYYKARSGNKLEPRRLKSLENVTHPALKEVKKEIMVNKESAYQEKLLGEYKEDVARNMSKKGF